MTVPTPPAVENDPSQSITISANPPSPASKVFTEEDIARARQQEKEKLYGQLQQQQDATKALQDELAALRKEREDRVAAEEAARQKAEEEARQRTEAEMSAKELLEARHAEYEQKLAELQRAREADLAALEKERQLAALRDYTQGRLAQEADAIAPELIDLVDGGTPEEVDASIERLKQKSAAIAEKVRGTQQQLQAQQRGVSPAGFNATGPMDMLPTTQTYSADDISNMSMKEYVEKIRGQFVGRGDAARNRGLYG